MKSDYPSHKVRKVLIVDDDVELADLLKQCIESEGFEVFHAADGVSGLQSVFALGVDLVVLDIMLPEQSGIEVLKQIRAQSQVPVLMLTARGDDTDRIVGLELGADDYVPKPASAREIVARIKAILRRSDHSVILNPAHQIPPVVVGKLRLDASARTLSIDGVLLSLTSTEFNFVEVLAKHAGSIVSKEALSEIVLGRPLKRFDRSIDVHISRVRDKIASHNHGKSLIITVYRQGYQLIKETS